MCTSEGSFTWLPVLFAYKGFILMAGLFLAFETRKVKIKSLNESRLIVMSVYGTVIISVTLTPIGFLLQHFPNVQYGIIGIMILLSISLILGLVFVIKVCKPIRIICIHCMLFYHPHSGTKYIKIQRAHVV